MEMDERLAHSSVDNLAGVPDKPVDESHCCNSG
jgi:hypothetical protein